MNFKVFATSFFEKKFKSLCKKFPKLPSDLKKLVEELESNPQAGDRLKGAIAPVYKIRMSSQDMKKGKSGAFRVIYFLRTQVGCVATGATRGEGDKNMHEALEMHVQGLKEDKLPIPESSSFAEYMAIA